MKLTKQRLIEIIKEEYQSILNESKTVKLGNIDLIFHDRDYAQIIGRKGKIHWVNLMLKLLFMRYKIIWVYIDEDYKITTKRDY